METTLKITVKNCGNAAGTLGWFKNLIDDSEINIKPCKDGAPGLFLHEKHKKDGSERTEHEGNSWICGIDDNRTDQYVRVNEKYAHVNIYENQYNSGFSSYVLTPACEKAVEKFINECMEKFIEWFEKQ